MNNLLSAAEFETGRLHEAVAASPLTPVWQVRDSWSAAADLAPLLGTTADPDRLCRLSLDPSLAVDRPDRRTPLAALAAMRILAVAEPLTVDRLFDILIRAAGLRTEIDADASIARRATGEESHRRGYSTVRSQLGNWLSQWETITEADLTIVLDSLDALAAYDLECVIPESPDIVRRARAGRDAAPVSVVLAALLFPALLITAGRLPHYVPSLIQGWIPSSENRLHRIARSARRARLDLADFALQRDRGLQALRDSGIRRRSSSRLPALLDLALAEPMLTADRVASRLRVSPGGAAMLLQQAVAAGLLRETTGRRRYRLYCLTLPGQPGRTEKPQFEPRGTADVPSLPPRPQSLEHAAFQAVLDEAERIAQRSAAALEHTASTQKDRRAR